MGRIIALTGRMGSGKSTVMEMIAELTPRSITTLKFAQPLYDMQDFIYERVQMEIPKPKDRLLLQWLGTEWGRSKDANLWVNVWKKEVCQHLELSPTSLVLNDDCRFDNEAEAVKSMDGIILKIEASDDTRGSRIALTNSNHPSERGLSESFIDFTIHNNGTKEDLERQVRTFLKTYRYDG